MNLRPLCASFGAELVDIDLRSPCADDSKALLDAVHEYRVVVVRAQFLTPEQQLAVSRSFGELYRMPYIEPMPDYPDVIAVFKHEDERNVSTFGSWWHADFSYLAQPPVYSLLQAVQLPRAGFGDTLFADAMTACEALSPTYRELLAELRVMHSGHIYGTQAPQAADEGPQSIRISRGNSEADVERAHPLVRVHQPTQRPALFANPTYTTRLEDMSVAESKPLLDSLLAHMTRPEHVLRFQWQPGDLLIWDNRAVMHKAINDYDGQRRLLHRTTVAAETPVKFAQT